MVDRSAALDYLCGRHSVVVQLHIIAWVMFALNTGAVAFGASETQNQVVIGLNYAGIVPTILATGAVMVACRRR